MAVMRMISRYMLPYKLMCGVFAVCILVEVAYVVAAPLSLEYLVDEAFERLTLDYPHLRAALEKSLEERMS